MIEILLIVEISKISIFFFGYSVFEWFMSKFLFLGWDEYCGLCIVVIKVVDYMSILVLVM